MAAFHEEAEVGFEEGMLWLPSHVLDEACDVKAYKKHPQHIHHHQYYQHRQHINFKTQTELQSQQYSKYGSRSYELRPKLGNGGSGMLAIFLESGQRSCGTGVFLPQGAGRKFQPSKKPACAPVLLPARVVQALNLDVQAIGLQISPHQDPKYNPRCRDLYNYSTNKKNDKKDDASTKQYCGVISENQSSSPEIFLPKDWSY